MRFIIIVCVLLFSGCITTGNSTDNNNFSSLAEAEEYMRVVGKFDAKCHYRNGNRNGPIDCHKVSE